MKIKKVQLITPYYEKERVFPARFIEPLGAESIATFFDRQYPEIEIEILHELVISEQEIMEKIKREKADIVGITDLYLTHNKTVKYAKQAKENDSVVVIGGSHASVVDYFEPEKDMASEILKKHQEIDFVIRDDGEEAFSILIEFLGKKRKIEDVPNLVYRNGKEIKKNSIKVIDLNRLPVTDRRFINYEPYWSNFSETYHDRYSGLERIASVYTSKGCPKAKKHGNCIFCGLVETHRKRNPKNVANEIKYLVKEFGISSIFGLHATMCDNKKWLEELSDYLKNVDISFFRVLARANEIDENTAKILTKLRTRSVLIGEESGNNFILYGINKQATLEQNIKSTEILARYDIELKPSFVLGLPNETRKSALDTLNLAEKLYRLGNIIEASASKVLVLPGSPLYEIAKSKFGFTCCLSHEEVGRYTRQKTCSVSEEFLDEIAEKILEKARFPNHLG